MLPRSTPLQPTGRLTLAPRRRITLYDRGAERRGQGPRVVAVVWWTGVDGRIEVTDARLRPLIEGLFSRSQLVPTGGGTAGGVRYDGVPRRLKAWRPETITYVVGSLLARYDLRGEVRAP